MAKGITDRAMSLLCRQISIMLKAGVKPDDAIASLSEDAPPGEGEILSSIYEGMSGGDSLADAVKNTGVFPGYVSDMIRIGELAGRLEQCFDSLSEYYERQAELKNKIKSSLLLPLILLMLMCVVLAVLVFAVLPVFSGVYENLSGSLSASSYSYVELAKLVGSVSLGLTMLISLAALAAALAARTEKGMRAVRRIFRVLPAVRKATYQLETSRLAGMLATLLASGASPDEALEIVVATKDFELLDKVLRECSKELAEGSSLAESFFAHRLFSSTYSRVLLATNASGNLDSGFRQLAEYAGEAGMDGLCRVIDSVEPCLTIFLTVAVGLSLLSTMLPLVGILGAIG